MSEVSTLSNLTFYLEVADQVAGDWRLTDEMKLECRLTEEWKYQDLKWSLPDEDTGKSFSEALILASSNPNYDKRLFINLPVQYMKTTSSKHVVHMNCFECQTCSLDVLLMFSQFSEVGIFMY